MSTSYSRQQILLHWATLGLFFVQLWTYPAIARTHVNHPLMVSDPWDLRLHKLHLISGGILFVLTLLRLWLRWRSPVLRPGRMRPVIWRLAVAAHLALLATLLLLPVSGFLKSYIVSAAGPVHILLTRLLYGLLVLHIGAAFAHAVILRDGLLARMGLRLPFQEPSDSTAEGRNNL